MSDRDRDILDALNRISSLDDSVSPPTWDHLLSRRRRRRVRRTATIGSPILLGAAFATGLTLFGGGSGGGVSTASGDKVTAATDDTAGGPNASGGQPSLSEPSCVSEYSTQALRHRAFAFDGTVVEVDDKAHDPKAPTADVVTARAVFNVHEWFSGGSAPTATVWMQRDVHPGDRLLVTGEPRWGGDPLDDAIAWECGYTAIYSPARAAEWRAALKG